MVALYIKAYGLMVRGLCRLQAILMGWFVVTAYLAG
jgi:hypothetical protein